jgi:hypothetical protein
VLPNCGLGPSGVGDLLGNHNLTERYPGVLPGWKMFCTTRPVHYYSIMFGVRLLLIEDAAAAWLLHA